MSPNRSSRSLNAAVLQNNLRLSSRGMRGAGGRAGPLIALSASTVLDSASVGTTIGTLSVLGGTGSYTFTLTSNPGSLFSITGTALKVAASLTAGSDAIMIRADNGAGSVVTQPFLITVTASGAPSAPVLALISVVGSAVSFSIDVDDAIAAGDSVQLQTQVAGGSWSPTVTDTTHVITSGEDTANEVDLTPAGFANGNYEARARVIRASDSVASGWSNTVPFTVSAAATSHRISSTGNNRISSAGNVRKFA